MWRKIGKVFLLIFIFWHRILYADDVLVEASVNAEEIGLNDTLIYTLTITCNFNTEPSQVKFPDFQGFKKLSQSQSSSMNIVIGGGQTFSRVKSYDIQLLPNKTGPVEIKPAVVVIKGKIYQTRSIKINVLPASRSSPQSQTPKSLRNLLRSPFDIDDLPFGSNISDEDIMLQAVVDKKTVYVGEEIVFSVYLYSSVQIYDIEQFTLPKFENAWVEDIYSPQKFTSEQKKVGQKVYNVYLMRRKAIFPNKVGIFEIEPSSIVLNVITGFNQKRMTRHTSSIKIDVRSLPETDMQPDFPVYNVGDYQISYSLTPSLQSIDKPFTLRIIVEGIGNINAFSLPRLKNNPELKYYDPVINTEIQTDNRIFKGKKSFEYLIFAKRTGKISLPAFDILYFKPETKSYEKVSISGLNIEVTEAENLQGIVKSGGNISEDERPFSIRFVNNTGDKFVGIDLISFLILSLIFPGVYFIIILRDAGKILFIYLGFDSEVSRRKRKMKRFIVTMERSYKEKKIEKYLESFYLAFSELLLIRYGINIKGMIREKLLLDLNSKGADESLIRDVESILELYEYIRFTGTNVKDFDITSLRDRFYSIMRKCGE